MPVITIDEKPESRRSASGDNAFDELVYLVRGTDSDVIARAFVEGSTPIYYKGLVRQEIGIEPNPETIDEIGALGHWLCTVRYGLRPPRSAGEFTLSFDTTGGTQHVTQSIATRGRYPKVPSAPNFGGAIGVTHDAVEGADITTPMYRFSESHTLTDAIVTPAYRAAVYFLTGRVNNAPFRGFAPGECLFLGAAGSRRGGEVLVGAWDVDFGFAASPNVKNYKVGGILIDEKRGWDYIWVRYADADDETAKAVVKRPVAAYVEQVYNDGDFSVLGIGT